MLKGATVAIILMLGSMNMCIILIQSEWLMHISFSMPKYEKKEQRTSSLRKQTPAKLSCKTGEL